MIIGGFEFPDRCPPNCKLKEEAFHQGSICHRCPLFNCVPIMDEFGNTFTLLDPEDYRHDWAEEWYKFFQGEKDYPELQLVSSPEGVNHGQA